MNNQEKIQTKDEETTALHKKIIDFVLRNSVIIAIVLFALYVITPTTQDLLTLRLIFVYEGVALFLSALGLWTYTKIPFLNLILSGPDKKLNSVEQHSAMQVMGDIFKGVHINVGLIVLAVYIAQFAN